MSQFDPKFLELKTKITAVLEMLIAEFPEAAIRAKHIILHYEDYLVEQEMARTDEAHGNAIGGLITGAAQLLAEVPDFVPEPEPEPEPEP